MYPVCIVQPSKYVIFLMRLAPEETSSAATWKQRKRFTSSVGILSSGWFLSALDRKVYSRVALSDQKEEMMSNFVRQANQSHLLYEKSLTESYHSGKLKGHVRKDGMHHSKTYLFLSFTFHFPKILNSLGKPFISDKISDDPGDM